MEQLKTLDKEYQEEIQLHAEEHMQDSEGPLQFVRGLSSYCCCSSLSCQIRTGPVRARKAQPRVGFGFGGSLASLQSATVRGWDITLSSDCDLDEAPAARSSRPRTPRLPPPLLGLSALPRPMVSTQAPPASLPWLPSLITRPARPTPPCLALKGRPSTVST